MAAWSWIEAGQGFPLVLLHGLGANSFSWRDNVRPLSREFRVLAPDLPAHGATPAAAASDFRLETLARGLITLLDDLRVNRAALVGNSLGGSLALLLAREAPARFPALVLLAPAAALSRVPWIFYPLRLPLLGPVLARICGPWILPGALRLAYHRRDLITPEVVAGYAPTLRPLANRLALQQLACQVDYWPPSRVEALLREIHQPVCLIWGEEDRILPPAQARWVAARLPQAEMHLLPQVGHAPQEEVPEVVNEIIIAFLHRVLKN
jgi:pimeloyl-ACP methyl ester carboxylesterase